MFINDGMDGGFGGMEVFFGLFFILFVGVIVVSIISSFKSKAFKQEIVTPIINEMFDNVVYNYKHGFDRDRIRSTNLVSHGRDFRSSDYISATHNGVAFEYSDIYMGDTTTDSQGHSHSTEYFKGQWLIIKPVRKISGRLYVIDKQLNHSSPQGGFIFKDKELDRVYTESDAFNKEYRIFASLPQEAFYILTPPKIIAFMDIHTDDVSFYQDANEIHIAIYSRKALLEPRLFSSNDDPGYVEEIKSTMLKVMSYLDYFETMKKGD